MYNFIGAYQIS